MQTTCGPTPPPGIVSPGRPWREWQAWSVLLLVTAIYVPRLTEPTVCGEESRWATVAREMITTGDYVVPRQQDTIFPERPPLGSWAMALVGSVRGQVDLWAIRLPSVLATLAVSLVIYGYARLGLSPGASAIAAAVYATFGQVLTLGRLGESEALFTLFVASSLLVWHAGYLLRYRPAVIWPLGYSLAALGALVKGPQAPVYFFVATAAYLAVERDWRTLWTPGYALGVAAFAALVGVWLVPFALAAGDSVVPIWTGLARERFTWSGLTTHLVSYPWETAGCLLPWSPLLLVLLDSRSRRALWAQPQVRFVVPALVVTYLSVWPAAGARGRYFMPMYPCAAVLIGWIIQWCTNVAAEDRVRQFWRRYLRGLSIAAVGGGVALVVASYGPDERLAVARQTPAFLAVWLVVASLAAAVLWTSARPSSSRGPLTAVFTVAALVGWAYTGTMLNIRVAGGNDLSGPASELRRRHDPPHMVSLRRVYHRFAFAYGEPVIRQVDWPSRPEDVPADMTYFCFDRWPGYFDPPSLADRHDEPGRTAPLPFAWERIAELNCDPVRRAEHHNRVVVGRVVRDGTATEPAANPAKRR